MLNIVVGVPTNHGITTSRLLSSSIISTRNSYRTHAMRPYHYNQTTIKLHPLNAELSNLPNTSKLPSAANLEISSVAIKEQE